MANKIVKGEITDPTMFAYIRAADPEKDNWKDPEVWKRVNPSFGITMTEPDFKRDCEAAQNNPAEENTFKRYRLNIWTKQTVRFIPMDAWDKCLKPITLESLKGAECYAGMDLSSVMDLSAVGLDLPYKIDGTTKHRLFVKYYIPEARATSRQNAKQVYYLDWAKRGLLTITPGDVLDYEYIVKDILQIAKDFRLLAIGYDPWNATQTAIELKERHGINMVEFRQGMVSMNEPTKNFLKLIMDRDIEQDGNEVTRWNIDNLQVKFDASSNVRPCKPEGEESYSKIDGAVVSIMAVAMANANIQVSSVYETRGLKTI
jgi:phage terminase large subunit-like protein